MGLSDEERLVKFYSGMAGWRRALLKLQANVEKDFKDIVDGWIREADTIVGVQIERTDTSGVYWIIGPNEDGFRGLWKQTHDLGRKDSLVREGPKEGSLDWWRDQLDLEEAARRWTQGKFTENRRVVALAHWWSAWDWIPALLYPVNRYPDKLFAAEVKERFVRLVGQMANLRLDVSQRWGHDRLDQLCDYEQALLCRYDLLHEVLQAEETKRWQGMFGDDEKRLKAVKATREDRFDGMKLIDEVGKLPLAEVARRLDKFRSEVWDRRHREDPSEKKDERTDGVLGPEPRSREELERIIETGTDFAEVEAAAQERETVYSTYYDGWRERFKKTDAKAKKVPIARVRGKKASS